MILFAILAVWALAVPATVLTAAWLTELRSRRRERRLRAELERLYAAPAADWRRQC